eukprot:TRINITY_DN3861_c0_g1_i1.p1 TRINITY_DN3861_c0_g1~~TRINITY_DN3861_c0_g1_i1.p1  ORF type:complete len:495 (-),score=162.16 TRINITY_DN3861_c0_g1_i1:92-1576(-)
MNKKISSNNINTLTLNKPENEVLNSEQKKPKSNKKESSKNNKSESQCEKEVIETENKKEEDTKQVVVPTNTVEVQEHSSMDAGVSGSTIDSDASDSSSDSDSSDSSDESSSDDSSSDSDSDNEDEGEMENDRNNQGEEEDMDMDIVSNGNSESCSSMESNSRGLTLADISTSTENHSTNSMNEVVEEQQQQEKNDENDEIQFHSLTNNKDNNDEDVDEYDFENRQSLVGFQFGSSRKRDKSYEVIASADDISRKIAPAPWEVRTNTNNNTKNNKNKKTKKEISKKRQLKHQNGQERSYDGFQEIQITPSVGDIIAWKYKAMSNSSIEIPYREGKVVEVKENSIDSTSIVVLEPFKAKFKNCRWVSVPVRMPPFELDLKIQGDIRLIYSKKTKVVKNQDKSKSVVNTPKRPPTKSLGIAHLLAEMEAKKSQLNSTPTTSKDTNTTIMNNNAIIEEESVEDPSDDDKFVMPCKYYSEGYCWRGAGCRYIHAKKNSN